MINATKYKQILNNLKGKTIAIVYIFENEDAPGFQHYWVWKSDIITGWMLAIQELGCVPFILDVRTFSQKAIHRTLPTIDYVINLNCGSVKLSAMSLIPSMCSFLGIPCIPCDAASIVTSENKYISNLLATALALNVPKSLPVTCENGIYRPLNLGSSIGVRRGCVEVNTDEGVYQEFIPGYDITIPIVYNPMLQGLDILPPILYLPKSLNPNWIYGENEKNNDDSFSTIPILNVELSLKKELLSFARIFPINSFGRIDARIKTCDTELSNEIEHVCLRRKDFYFIEINSMPTIEPEDSFELAYTTARNDPQNCFFNCIQTYLEVFPSKRINSFILSSSMIALAKAKY